jgi:hypothetical protein
MHTFKKKVFVPSYKNVWLFYNKMIEIKWKQYKQVNQFFMLITLHVSVFLDHHQVCMNKTIKYTTFMLNYMMKKDPFFNITN